MPTTIASYRLISENIERSLKTTAGQPLVARESAYYAETIGTVKTIDEFLDNDRLYSFAMKAHGLEDLTYARAFMRKVLDEGIDASDSFANSLSDTRYRDFATTFNFNSFGAATTAFDRAQQGTIDRYVRLTMEENAGVENQGVRLALYFARKAPEIESAFSLLADTALLQVTQTALQLPSSTSAIDIDRQAELINKRLDIEDFKDPIKLQSFLSRFTSLWELSNPTAAPSIPNILIGGPRALGIGEGLLASLQNLKLGGR